jgi:tRNA(Arg) A34 adenosine deaminase TadA
MDDALHEGFLREAIALSRESVELSQGGPFGAVIVKEGEIIGRGMNQVTCCCDPTAHAEMTAIRQAAAYLNRFDLSGCVIYTSTEPCPMCLAAIYWARLDAIYYANTREDAAAIGFDDARLYREVCLPANERSIPMVQILAEDAHNALQAWQAKTDKVPY